MARNIKRTVVSTQITPVCINENFEIEMKPYFVELGKVSESKALRLAKEQFNECVKVKLDYKAAVYAMTLGDFVNYGTFVENVEYDENTGSDDDDE